MEKIDIVEHKIKLGELLYFTFVTLLMGAKAVGMSEGQRPFTAILYLSLLVFAAKMLSTKYMIYEWIISILLIALGTMVYLKTGHLEALFAVCFIVGMKGVCLKRVTYLSLLIWLTCFVMSVIRALLGFYDGYIGVQLKMGMTTPIIRYSLGYTHPNVLHVTYLIIVLLIFYIAKEDKKRVFLLSFLLLAGNFYIFSYSVSYTGFISVCFSIFLTIYLFCRNRITLLEKILLFIFVSMCFLFIVLGPVISSENMVNLFNRILNGRFLYIRWLLTEHPLKLIGNSPIEDPHLNADSSYVYMIIYQGLIMACLFFVSFMATFIDKLKKNDKKGISLLSTVALSGMIEQYVGNLSFKNISLFFIGDYFFNTLAEGLKNKNITLLTNEIGLNIADSEYSLSGIANINKRRKIYFKGTNYLKCILPAMVVAIVSLLVVSNIYIAPEHVYFNATYDEAETKLFQYEGKDKESYGKALFIGSINEGDWVGEYTWADTKYERYRALISAFVWGFIIGFSVASVFQNIRKLNKVYIEKPLFTGKAEKIKGMPSCPILGTNIAVTDMRRTVEYLSQNIDELRGEYICVSNVHTTEMAFSDKNYRNIQNGAIFALPDGMPLSYVMRNRGYLEADRVAGPDLMREIFLISAGKGYRHVFFGSTEETLNKLKEKLTKEYPGICIAGMISPDYYKHIEDIPKDVNDRYVDEINSYNPDFVWIGLGAPKQEQWMALNKGRINAVMLGVGAGFDFHAGTVKRAPRWMQALYLEWLYRLFQDPKRLFKRYFSTNFKFIKDIRWENKHLNEVSIDNGKKKLLIYAHYYLPDVASTGQILSELAEGISDDIDVSVISVVPSYNGKIDEHYKMYRYYKQEVNGVTVYRTRVPEYTKKNKLSRVWNIWEYFRGARALTKKLGKQDYVFTISQPPILGGMLGLYGKRVKKAKLIYNIQDFNPEQIESVEYSRSKSLLKLLKRVDINTCKKSDLVITVGRDLIETLEKRFNGTVPTEYVMINNWIDEETIKPLNSDDSSVLSFREKYNLTDKFIFMYSGNIGLYYDLKNILKTIEKVPSDLKTKDGKEIVFAFVGDGGYKTILEQYANDHGMKNVVFIPYQNKDELIYSLNAADVHICVNAKGIKGVSCPSKYYGIAAVAKPVLAVLEEGSEIRSLIEENNGGLISSPEDYDELFNNIMRFIDMSGEDELIKMGMNGREYLENNLRKKTSIEKYKEAILSLEN